MRIVRQRSTCSRSSLRSSRHGPVLGQGVVELLRHQRDGGERRAELVRRGGGEAVELGQVLLARQHELRGGERLGELARFLGHPPGIDAREGRSEEDRRPDAGDIDERNVEGLAGKPGQGLVHQDEERGASRPPGGPSPSVRSGVSAVAEIRTGARKSIEKGFCRPAGEVEQGRELQNVEGQKYRRGVVASRWLAG